MPNKQTIPAGTRFARLVVIGLTTSSKHRESRSVCRCDCGAIKIAKNRSLVSGKTNSCGCLTFERRSAGHRKHGFCAFGTNLHPIYKVWSGIRSRCTSKTSSGYKNYGGRGIKVCKRWDSFELFLKDMGERPPGTSLDRIDNNGNYEPGNCRWATPKEQRRNTRQNKIMTFGGVTCCRKDMCERLEISQSTFLRRIKNGVSASVAFTELVGKKSKK